MSLRCIPHHVQPDSGPETFSTVQCASHTLLLLQVAEADAVLATKRKRSGKDVPLTEVGWVSGAHQGSSGLIRATFLPWFAPCHSVGNLWLSFILGETGRCQRGPSFLRATRGVAAGGGASAISLARAPRGAGSPRRRGANDVTSCIVKSQISPPLSRRPETLLPEGFLGRLWLISQR